MAGWHVVAWQLVSTRRHADNRAAVASVCPQPTRRRCRCHAQQQTRQRDDGRCGSSTTDTVARAPQWQSQQLRKRRRDDDTSKQGGGAAAADAFAQRRNKHGDDAVFFLGFLRHPPLDLQRQARGARGARAMACSLFVRRKGDGRYLKVFSGRQSYFKDCTRVLTFYRTTEKPDLRS